LLEKILVTLQRIEVSINKINQQITSLSNKSLQLDQFDLNESLDIMTILQNLDTSLIPTIRALFLLKDGGTAEDIADITGRSRSRENQHLNKLSELNYIEKIREGREIKFKIRSNFTKSKS
ncbi:MAG: winged helix-turn-helix domain-containing protein, partial [Candidatus Thorarchaeota archaeon]